MITSFYFPASPLSRYIDCFWHSDGSAPYGREKILPAPEIEIMFNFGAPSRVSEPSCPERFRDDKDRWVEGLRSGYVLLEFPPDMHLLSIVFKPGGVFPFLRFPISELRDQMVSLDSVWGCFAAELHERLYDAPSVQARFALLECRLLARLQEHPDGLDVVQFAISEIARNHGAISVRELSESIGISHKHLIAQFKRMVGAAPKQLARIYRFQHVLHTIDPAQPVNWTQIAHQSGYYDQSHFNKDFEAFTGNSPTEYLCLRRQVYSDNPEHAQFLRHLPTG